MATLPSLVDVVTVVVLLLPGFVSFVLFKWISIIERKISDFELVIWSLFMSLFVYAIFSVITGLSNIDSIRDSIFMPSNIAIILSLSLTVGIVPGAITRYVFRKRVVRGDCWDVCMNRTQNEKKFWVIVYTENGLEYKGRLHLYGTEGGNKRELVIEDPKLISRDETGTILSEMKMGREILFLPNDIRRVVFLEDLRETQKKP